MDPYEPAVDVFLLGIALLAQDDVRLSDTVLILLQFHVIFRQLVSTALHIGDKLASGKNNVALLLFNMFFIK